MSLPGVLVGANASHGMAKHDGHISLHRDGASNDYYLLDNRTGELSIALRPPLNEEFVLDFTDEDDPPVYAFIASSSEKDWVCVYYPLPPKLLF